MYVCFFLNMSSRILNKSDAFFKPFLFAWIFFCFFPHPPHHFSNGPSLREEGICCATKPLHRNSDAVPRIMIFLCVWFNN